MKKLFIIVAAAMICLPLAAQQPAETKQEGPYQFTVTNEVAATPVRNQSASGTCWSFAGIGMLESDLLRQGKGEQNLSEMWIVRHTYYEKAVKYVRMHGTIEFSAGGATHDVYNMISKYGIVPEEVYTGLNYGTDFHRHAEMDAALRAYVDAIVKNPNRSLSTSWLDGIDGILDAYLGERPEKFTYKGKEYTPKSYAASLGLDMDDYVAFTSYTHHPFYSPQFALEVPDNWAWGLYYNVPVAELMQLIDNSIEKGYAVDWAADVSEGGFLYMKGYAVVPLESGEDMFGTELSRWVRMSPQQQQAMLASATEPIKENVVITQEMRQMAFDNYQTTDDHGMLITGIAVDQTGARFYKVKNSWGTDQLYEGYFYASRPFVAYKTMGITVHKDVIPKDIKKKLGIK